MSLLYRLFNKRKEEDYETILSKLASDIQKRQTQLSEIRLRERRATLLVTLYTLGAWVAYVSLWYMDILPFFNRYHTASGMQKGIRILPVALGPVLILFIRRIVQIWYSRKGNAEERTLQQLLRQQRSKVEEIKKKTNYYSTRDLIQRYDEPSPANTPLRQRNVSLQPPPQPVTPQHQVVSSNGSPQVALTPALRQQLSPIAPTPVGPPRKQWFDKLADAVLGEEDSSRYALICEKCFSHNGLVKESVWEETQYVCPKCNHFNPSKRSKAKGSSPQASPSSMTSPTSKPPGPTETLNAKSLSSPRSPPSPPAEDARMKDVFED